MNLELWGGVECTINRVGDSYFDQMEKSGHANRPEDLDRFAALGLRTIRYPVLWEKVQPVSPDRFDWEWSDARLGRLRALGMRPIVGLLHHGSGPRWTDLLDAEFPRKFAAYALAVARRYAWVDAYTPINEPLTTARFSGLYGHWFPHRRDDATFHKILLNEIEATTLAMAAIRSVRPDAQLVQTEDLGKVFSTPLLQYQADFENERRWISFDLLSGRFDGRHPLWRFVTGTPGADLEQMERILGRPCPPDIYGVNYYVTSERFLDHDLAAHPADTHGGNRFHNYADVASVRIHPEGLIGSAELLKEIHHRYKCPVALTEVHLGCTRDEQLRWLMQAWRTGQRLNQEGVPLRAVTAWALLGAHNWNTLVTRESGCYEPGAFDVRRETPRPTALASAIQSLNASAGFRHPVLDVPGWWRRPDRIPERAPLLVAGARHARPILVLGGMGTIGRALGHVCASRGLVHRLLPRAEADLCNPASIRRAVEKYGPWAVINAASYHYVDEAEWEPGRCHDVNVLGAASVAGVCAAAGLPLISFSSDLVFDGEKTSPYKEDDATHPLSVYGRAKARAEREVLAMHPQALVIRTSPLITPWLPWPLAASILQRGSELVVPDGEISPTYAPDLCHALLDLLIDGECGIWHLANRGRISWCDFVVTLGERLGVRDLKVEIAPRNRLVTPRPSQSILASVHGELMPTLEDALSRFEAEANSGEALLRNTDSLYATEADVLA